MRLATLLIIGILMPSLTQARDCGLFEYRAIVTGVYDGDSVTADVYLGMDTWRHNTKLRLLGVDTPEIKSASRAQAIIARDQLRGLILGKEIRLCTDEDKTEKYGRHLAWIYLDNINVNAWLKMRKLGKPYKAN